MYSISLKQESIVSSLSSAQYLFCIIMCSKCVASIAWIASKGRAHISQASVDSDRATSEVESISMENDRQLI